MSPMSRVRSLLLCALPVVCAMIVALAAASAGAAETAAANAAEAKTGAAPSVHFSPLSAEFVARPGERLAQEFRVTNDGERPLELELSTSDVWHANGRRTFPAPGEAPRGAGAWLIAPPSRIVVQPGETQTFAGAARVPEGTPPGAYFGAYLARVVGGDTAGAVPKRAIAAGARMQIQFALLLVIRVPNTNGQLATAELSVLDAEVVEAGEARPLVVRAVVHNDSVVDARTEGSLVLFDAGGRPLGRSGFSRARLLPGERREFSTSLALPLDSGDYRAVLAFAGVDSRPTVHDLRFSVTAEADEPAPVIESPTRMKPAKPKPAPFGPGEPGSSGR